MSTTVSPTDAKVTPASCSLQIPADGEAADSASINQFIQTITDRNLFTLTALYGNHARPLVSCFDGINISVGALFGVVLTSGGAWYAKTRAAGTATVAHLEGGGAFAAGTHYFLYTYISAGVLEYQISAVVPDAYLRFKTGSTDHAYLAPIYSNAAPALDPFVYRGGFYTFGDPDAWGGAISSVGAYADITSSRIPPTVRMICVRIDGYMSHASNIGTVELRSKGYASAVNAISFPSKFTDAAGGTGGLFRRSFTTWIALDSSRRWEAQISSADLTLGYKIVAMFEG